MHPRFAAREHKSRGLSALRCESALPSCDGRPRLPGALPFRALGAPLARRADDELAIEREGFELEAEAYAADVRERRALSESAVGQNDSAEASGAGTRPPQHSR